MQNLIEIKSMSKEAAVQRALKILDATPEQVVSVEEKVKSRSFLGLFNKEGIYAITIDKTLMKKSATSDFSKNEQKIEETIIEKEVKPKENIVVKDILETKKIENPKENLKKDYIKKQVKNDKETVILKKTRELLKNMNLNLEAEIASKEGKYYVVNLFGDDNGIIIGKKGKTLNSFEYLLNCILKDCKIELDVEGFKEKRKETLRELGRKMAKKALITGKTIRLNPMPPRERKIIHEIINRFEGLDTFSEGADPKRYIVIKRKKLENTKINDKTEIEVKTEE
ncbi:MAG: protein jag [Cetobacterium sp.]